MYENRREIMQDVFLTYLPARKFKTSRLTVNLITGLDRAAASANALLPAVLSRGTARCPDMGSASASALPPRSSTMHLHPTGKSCWSRWHS